MPLSSKGEGRSVEFKLILGAEFLNRSSSKRERGEGGENREGRRKGRGRTREKRDGERKEGRGGRRK